MLVIPRSLLRNRFFDGVPCYSGRHRVSKEGGRNRVGISTHSPEANACQQPSEAEGSWQTQRKIGRRLRGTKGAGRCRGRLVRDSGEPGELADAEEDWSEAQGSQGSYLA